MPMPHLSTFNVEDLLAFHRSKFGNAVMTMPNVDAPPANDPAGVWSGDVQPPTAVTTVPSPTNTLPPRDPSTGQFTAEDIQRARREERDAQGSWRR